MNLQEERIRQEELFYDCHAKAIDKAWEQYQKIKDEKLLRVINNLTRNAGKLRNLIEKDKKIWKQET